MIELTDTHCHIQSAGLDEGEKVTRELWGKAPELMRAQIIKNAIEADVTRMICVGCDLADSQLAVEFVQDQPNCWASIGIHPHEAAEALAHGRILPQFAGLVHQPKVIAIGECGLDFFYNHSPKEEQIKVLRFQLALAAETAMPVIFHVREAFDVFWPIFEEYKVRGVLHSFTDSKENLQRAIKHGLYVGVNGIATFVKDLRRLEVYKSIPHGNLLLETDAPFLAPAPYRGQVCEPKHVRTTAEFLAELRGEKLEEIAIATTANAQKLFGLK